MIVHQMKFENEKNIKLKMIENYKDNLGEGKFCRMEIFFLLGRGNLTRSYSKLFRR